MYRSLYISIISCLLITLWVYAAISKLLDFDKYVWELKNQVFGVEFALVLVFLIPLSELAAVLLLSLKKTRSYGLQLSALLLLLFSAYIVTLLFGAYDRVPCVCGGILGRMSWEMHLVFNALFLILTLSALILDTKERRLYEMK